MRLIQTFILRLYTDSDLSEKICGNLQQLPERKIFPFKNNAELLDLLHRLANKQAGELPMRTSKDENELNSSVSNQPVE